MANLFLDANYFIDFTERQKLDLKEKLIGNKLYVSVLSVQILAYAYKYKVPNEKLKEYLLFYNTKRVHCAFDNKLTPLEVLTKSDYYVSKLPEECRNGWGYSKACFF